MASPVPDLNEPLPNLLDLNKPIKEFDSDELNQTNDLAMVIQGEERPLRVVKYKSYIEKVMVLGKIGISPFTYREPAQRSSVNRPLGTMITKAMTSISRRLSGRFSLTRLPVIREKWPREDSGCPIFIQQDNARNHIDPNDEEFCRASKQDGFDIRLYCQPPNSPNLNVLDFVHAVEEAYDDFSVASSNHVFLSQQACMREIIKAKGSQDYDTPHIGKAASGKNGDLLELD
ncbi:uncharacterized protein LOC133917934 [Phragmites australis]|uniref:uncharacterized protein LOC133917934 n=1 Tax=Phragmites australis TaxID=29695 RepID=UPI002D78AA00|nr:uncharacterized protein LOC133917934 [Phragmites australis]